MQVVVPVLTYREQFQDIKGRIDKCEARRVEFDRCAMELTNIPIIPRAAFMAKEMEATAPADRLEIARYTSSLAS